MSVPTPHVWLQPLLKSYIAPDSGAVCASAVHTPGHGDGPARLRSTEGASGGVRPLSCLQATALFRWRRSLDGGTCPFDIAVWQRWHSDAPAVPMDMSCSESSSRVCCDPVARRGAHAPADVGYMHPRWAGSAPPRWSSRTCICGRATLPPCLNMASHCGDASLLYGSAVCCEQKRCGVSRLSALAC